MGARFFIAVVRVYQWVLSPVMHFLFGAPGACRYTPTCSCYAIEAFQRHGAFGGLRLTTARLLRCHPWGSSGFDPVPVDPDPNHTRDRNRNLLNRLGAKLRVGLRKKAGEKHI